MRVYHGSNSVVRNPDVSHSRRGVNFGKGFYVTAKYDQAKKWSDKFGNDRVVSFYEYNGQTDGLKVKTFETHSGEWLDFVLDCRKGIDSYDYDIVFGGAVDDRLFDIIHLYIGGFINREEALGRLRLEEPNMQIVFRTDKAIKQCLEFIGSENTVANPDLLHKKYARVVALYSKTTGLGIEESLDRFYLSKTYHYMRRGTSNMHCMGELYLVDELIDESKTDVI